MSNKKNTPIPEVQLTEVFQAEKKTVTYKDVRISDFLTGNFRRAYWPEQLLYLMGNFPPNYSNSRWQILNLNEICDSEKFPENYKLLHDDMSDFNTAMNTLSIARRLFASEHELDKFNLKRNIPGNKQLTLDEIDGIANQAIEKISSIRDNIVAWLDSHKPFHDAYKKISKKKYSFFVPETINGKPRFPMENEKLMILVYIIIDVIYDSFKLSYHRLKPPTKHAVKLAKQLQKELITSASMTTSSLVKELEKVIDADNYTKPFLSNVKKEPIMMRKDLVELLGKKMKHNFSFISAEKGRPYPDVIVELLRLFGHEIEKRQADRYLKIFDDPELI